MSEPVTEIDALENDIRELAGAAPGELARRLIERGWGREAAALAGPGADRLAKALDLLAAGITAFHYTREYVGAERLPAVKGWSWFEWTEAAAAFIDASRSETT